jgi:hypothetical protein
VSHCTEYSRPLLSLCRRRYARPAERYLTTYFFRGRMRLGIYYDANVYGREMMNELLTEIEAAAIFYLG